MAIFAFITAPPKNEAAPAIIVKDHAYYVKSTNIAKDFDKEHKNVLRDIEQKKRDLNDPEWDRLNFEPIFQEDVYGRKQPAYLLSEKAFSLIVMGFTGKKALVWQRKYIDAFEAMRARMSLSQKIMRLGTNPRTKRIASYYNRGFSTQETARQMGLSPKTIRYHLQYCQAMNLIVPTPKRLVQQTHANIKLLGRA
jgi:Rha family phage regulatory protein